MEHVTFVRRVHAIHHEHHQWGRDASGHQPDLRLDVPDHASRRSNDPSPGPRLLGPKSQQKEANSKAQIHTMDNMAHRTRNSPLHTRVRRRMRSTEAQRP